MHRKTKRKMTSSHVCRALSIWWQMWLRRKCTCCVGFCVFTTDNKKKVERKLLLAGGRLFNTHRARNTYTRALAFGLRLCLMRKNTIPNGQIMIIGKKITFHTINNRFVLINVTRAQPKDRATRAAETENCKRDSVTDSLFVIIGSFSDPNKCKCC